MTEPQTEAGRMLAARAKREAFGAWEGIAQFEIPAIEQEARHAALAEVRRGVPVKEGGDHPNERERAWNRAIDRFAAILDAAETP